MNVSAACLRVLIAVLLLVGRPLILGPASSGASAAMTGELAALIGDVAICHTGGAEPAGQAPACLLCPACHVTGQATLPVTARVIVAYPPAVAIGHAALPPPATGPPHPARLAARPTGPPTLSI